MCRIDYADDDGAICLRSGDHRARKDRTCGDCSRTIMWGERYWSATWLYEGRFDTFSMCAHCHEASNWLTAVCGGWLWNGVVEELREHWDEEHDLRSVGLGRLVLAGERRWRRERPPFFYGKGLIPVETVKRWTSEAVAQVPETALH